jgi:protein-tyrosine sulfotransferase
VVSRLFSTYLRNPSRLVRNLTWRFPSAPSTERHVFIVGAPRSGTTLLQTLIAVHSKYCGITGETGMFTYQDIFGEARNYGALPKGDVANLLARSSDVVTLLDNLAAKFKEHEDQRAIEKTPQHVNHLPFILKWFPRAQVVNMYRDGRDCYCSARTYAGVPTGRELQDFAKYWVKCIASRQKLGEHPAIYDLSYERLTSDPTTEMAALMAFLGDEFLPEQVDPQHYSKQTNRLQKEGFEKLSKPINTSSQGRWKQELSAEEIAQFNTIAGPQLQGLGYDLEG